MDFVSADTAAPGGKTAGTACEDKNISRNTEEGRNLTQIVAAFAVYMSTLVYGMNYGFSAILFPQLLEKNEIPMTKEQMSWIASLLPLGLITGSPLGGALGRGLGLKTAVCVGCLVQLPGWIIIAGADNVEMIYIGRTLTGIGVGLALSNEVSFISDISEERLRGILHALATVFLNTGCVIIYAAGALIEWRWVCFLASGFLLSCLFISYFLPESPVWLISNGRMEAAATALLWLRGKHYNVKTELNHIREAIKANPVNVTWLENMQKIKQTRVLKPFAVLMFVTFTQQWSGMTVISMYAVTLLQAADSSVDEYLGAVIIGTVCIIGNILAMALLRKYGRRPILMVSFLSGTLSMGILGLSFYMLLSDVQTITEVWKWIILLSLSTFSVSHCIGKGTVPRILLGEVYPEDVSAFAAGLTTSLNYVFAFSSVKLFPTFETLMSLHATFWLYSGINLIGMIVTIFFVPETKGKTFAELQVLYRETVADVQIQ